MSKERRLRNQVSNDCIMIVELKKTPPPAHDTCTVASFRLLCPSPLSKHLWLDESGISQVYTAPTIACNHKTEAPNEKQRRLERLRYCKFSSSDTHPYSSLVSLVIVTSRLFCSSKLSLPFTLVKGVVNVFWLGLLLWFRHRLIRLALQRKMASLLVRLACIAS